MLTKPFAGWTDITLDNKSFFRCSYLTDVPMDLLIEFIKCLETKQECKIEFDAEGWEHCLIVNTQNSKEIIFNEKKTEIISKKNIYDLSKELISDIESYLDDWVMWEPCIEVESKKEIKNRKNKMIKLLKKIKELTN